MSFTTNIDGSIGGNSVLVFNSVNVCTDNVSCDNLSATNASIINLTTNYFEPSSIFSPLVEGTHGEFDNCSVNNLSILNDVSIVGNLDLTNISIQNASVSNDLSVDNEISTTFLSCFGDINCSANISGGSLNINDDAIILGNISGNSLNISNYANVSGRVGLNGIDFKRTPNDGGGIPAFLNVNSASLQMYLNYSMTFNRNTSGFVFMKLDYAQNNVNMSNLSVYNLSLTNSNVSNMSVDNLSTNLLNNISAGNFITLSTEAGTNKLIITGQGGLNSSNLSLDNLSVSDSLTSVKMNVSNLSVNNLSTDLLNNISAGNNITLSTDATTNKIVITGAGTSVSGNVSVSDFVETITIIPSGTLAFPAQGINQTSNFITCKQSQDGADYTSANMFQVNAGDKLHFTWKQSAWKQSSPALGAINCYLISGTAPPSGSNRTRVGIIYSYVYPASDHEDIVGTFIYVAPTSFQFYRSQMVVTGGLVTQGQDYSSATCTIYRATIPNKITIPNLLNVSNISVDNLSTNLLNNLSAGENISLTTDPITQQIVITSLGVLNSSNLSLDNLSVSDSLTSVKINVSNLSVNNLSTNLLNNLSAGENITLSTDPITQQIVITGQGGLNSSNLSLDNLSVSGNINVSNLSIAGDTDMRGKLTIGDIEFKNIGSTAVVSYLQTNMPSMKWYLSKTMDFRKDDEAGIVFMRLNHNVGNVNISNLSNANLSVVNISCEGDLNVSYINASTIHTERLNVSGSAPLFTDGLNIYGLTTTQNISTNHISSTGFITATGDVRASGGFRAIGGSGIYTTGAIQINNANDGTGDTLEIYYTGTQFGMGTTSGKDFTINNGYNTGGLVIDGTLNNVNMSNCSIDNLSSTNISISNDMTITRDLEVERYLSYKPRLLTRWRDNVYVITGTAQDIQWNRDETAMAGGALQVSGDGIQALLAGWYRVDWSVGFRKLNDTGGERMTTRTYLRINNVFSGKYGFGTTTYLRSATINRSGYGTGSVLVYANTNDIIHIRADCLLQGNVDFTSDFNGQRVLASSRFSCEYISNSGES
jgi:hypothetical protein